MEDWGKAETWIGGFRPIQRSILRSGAFAILQAFPLTGCNDTVRKVLLLVLCVAALMGCGFKGPLEIPTPNPDESDSEYVPTSSQRHPSD